MTSRDLVWRLAGISLLTLGCTAGAAARCGIVEGGNEIVLPAFVVAIAGLILAVQGKRVALALRIERSRHRDLPRAIHRRRGRNF